jgi:DNA helicase-2/ATP-dependent DNA helicase PcrA
VIDESTAEALQADLTPAQRHAVTTDATPLCILAAAGAGKTRVLTRRIAYRVSTGTADPSRVLALTFTRKAAGELTSRLQATGMRDRVTAGTFHAVAAAQLRRWWADRGQAAPTLLDRKGRLLGPLLASRPALAGVTVAEVAAQIEWAKARLVAPGQLGPAAGAAGRTLPAAAADLDAIYERYEHEKTRRGLLDFDDLLARCADAIGRDPVFAAAQRWRWRHVFVDEFQDLNPLQHRLLLAWVGTSVDLCVVGDPNQAIYGWNGADPGLLASFPARWPGGEVVHLDANHRCSPQIVAAAAAVLGAKGSHLVSSRPDGPEVTVRSWPSEAGEAAGVAAAVRRAHADGRSWAQLAVLIRTNAQAVPIADACRSAGIPVRTPGTAALLDHLAVRHALADLKGRPDASIRTAVFDLDQWAMAAVDGDHAVAIGAVADLARYAERLDSAMTVRAWLDWLPVTLGRDDPDGVKDAVTICSFHRAKGLQWTSVWVCGLEVGLSPIGHASGPAAQAEERRLLYVALTRAETDLHCSWAEQRTFGGRAVRREPSPWLTAIRAPSAGTAPPEGGVDSAEWQRRLIAQRDRLRAGRGDGHSNPSRSADWSSPRRRRRAGSVPPDWPPPDARVLEALRSWRADAARAAAVPAHVVLHDTILDALASLRPTDEAGLLALPGLGPVKANRYGPTLLALVAERAVSA